MHINFFHQLSSYGLTDSKEDQSKYIVQHLVTQVRNPFMWYTLLDR